MILDEKFYLAICFFIFLYLVYRPIKKGLLAFLDSRINEIKHQISDAEQIKNEALQLYNSTLHNLEQMNLIKDSNIKEAQLSAQKILANKQEEMKQFIQKKQEDLNYIIAKQGQDMKKNLSNELCKNVINSIRQYFDSNVKMSDIDIAKRLMKDKNL